MQNAGRSFAFLNRFSKFFTVSCVALAVLCSVATADPIPLTIFHTNDVHSHFKPDTGPFKLGGVARLATALRRARAQVQNSLLLDGGDFTEGHIYYNVNAGRGSFEMMNAIGYDAIVIGNHDWLNGPDQILDSLQQVKPSFSLLSANIDTSEYPRNADFDQVVTPWKMFNVGGLKVGVIGVSTYELIYDKFFKPIKIKFPYPIVEKLSKRLKTQEGADLVIVISHNGLKTNRFIATMKNVDLVIHAHDHLKLPQALEVEDGGKKGYLVETGCWGQFFGRVDLMVDPVAKTVALKDYYLTQVDDTFPADPTISSMVQVYEKEVVQKFGNIFSDHIALLGSDLRRESKENLLGNVVTDAYRAHTGADIALEQVNLTSTSLWAGFINTADVFNMIPAIFNFQTNKAWTIKTFKITGETLDWIMNFVVSIQSMLPGGLISSSGMYMVYDAADAEKASEEVAKGENSSRRPLKKLEVGGLPLDPKKLYTMAVSQGMIEAIDFLKASGNNIEMIDYADTGDESWRVIANYLQKNSPWDPSKVSRGNRITVVEPDVGIYNDDVISITRTGLNVDIKLHITNFGTSKSSDRVLAAGTDKTPDNAIDDPNADVRVTGIAVPALNPGASTNVTFSFSLPPGFENKKVPIYFWLNDSKDDPNKSNDSTWVMLK